VTVRNYVALFTIFLSSSFAKGQTATHLIRSQQPPLLSFDDLVSLASVDPPPPDLQKRLDALLSEPFISNEASLAGAEPRKPVVRGIGPVLRIAEWNINRLDKESMRLALSDRQGYYQAARENPKLKRKALNRALAEVDNLQGADVIVLDEIDDGVKRSGYHNVPRDLAQLLHMNYAYAVEFVELNSIYLGVKKIDIVDLARQRQAKETFGVNPARDLALEGTALLSRFPILNARIVPLPEEYDWYHGEIGAISELEKAEKWSAKKLFDERLARQVRRGGRLLLLVQLAVPGVPSGVLTVACPHLEDYATPKGRREQMNFVLQQIAGIPGPLVSAGDLNTLGHDGTPVTTKRVIKRYLENYRFWLREAFYLILPIPGVHYAVTAINYFKNYHDPTATNIPILAPNHSEPLFADLRKFRFADGGRFDWAGRKQDSFHRKGRTLSDSDERAWKGFATTFSYRRTYHGLVGEWKIDWILAKSVVPHSGRTLCDLNTATAERISDHCPTTVDFPLH